MSDSALRLERDHPLMKKWRAENNIPEEPHLEHLMLLIHKVKVSGQLHLPKNTEKAVLRRDNFDRLCDVLLEHVKQSSSEGS